MRSRSTSIDEIGVGEPHAIADRRAEHFGVGAAIDFHRAPRFPSFAAGSAFFAGRSSGPITAPVKP
mgnify:CR=1 FL=1